MDFKFSCPQCGQHISCTDQWSGQQIQCPTCKGNIVVPQVRPVAAETSAPQVSAAPPPPPPRQAAPPPPPPPASRPFVPPGQAKASGDKTKYLILGAKIVVGGIIMTALLYFGRSWQTKVSNIKPGDGDGGEVGHIADVYDALDRTEPENMGMSSAEAKQAKKEAAAEQAKIDKEIADKEAVEKAKLEREQMIVPAVWTLDLDAAVIPEGRANGMISGFNFVGHTAQIIKAAGQPVLNIREGTNAATEREFFVYLRTGAVSQLTNQTWTVSKDEKPKTITQVVKRWKKGPAYSPQQNAFKAGYVLKLEFGDLDEDLYLPGKIFLAMPDTDQSVVAGGFKIETEERREMLRALERMRFDRE